MLFLTNILITANQQVFTIEKSVFKLKFPYFIDFVYTATIISEYKDIIANVIKNCNLFIK